MGVQLIGNTSGSNRRVTYRIAKSRTLASPALNVNIGKGSADSLENTILDLNLLYVG